MKRIQELEGELQNEKKQLKQSASVRKLHKPEQKL